MELSYNGSLNCKHQQLTATEQYTVGGHVYIVNIPVPHTA